MTVAQKIEEKLRAALNVHELVLDNVSHHHAGHASSPGTGESHFNLRLVSPDFEGKSRIERQKLVYQLLAEELQGPIHALSLKILTPAEA
ncbi:BolA family transcriptional regulator [bacterium CPR1]|nr:BolA family transcriptional regulator [bacterium CPR1]